MVTALTYGECGLDRAHRLRADAVWLDERRRDPASRYIVLWQGRVLTRVGEPTTAVVVDGGEGPRIARSAAEWVLLGIDGSGGAWFAIDLADDDAGRIESAMSGRFVELRRVSSALTHDEGSRLAYARALPLWHRRNRHCGACGGQTESQEAGHVRLCTDPACGVQHFPRIDPTVIVLVTRAGANGDSCLLARQPTFPLGLMSTIAGFVEPGESLEEAVRREVLDECGVAVRNVRYVGSQPWPFPASLMLGFRAEAETEAAIQVDGQELEAAEWFTRADLRRFRERGLKLPTGDSISRALVEGWLAEDGGGPSHAPGGRRDDASVGADTSGATG
jgi:NAD+ diphosphatase